MGLPVTVYRHTDAGAPVVRPRRPSDWLTIIKACLVDGYGDKTPLGWTLDFSSPDNLKMVFRNSNTDGGSGGAVQVEAHGGTDAVGQLVRFTCAVSIVALNEYFKKVGYRVIPTVDNASWLAGWMIIGTSRGFWLIQESGATINNQTDSSRAMFQEYYFIGDIDSFIPNDPSIFTILSSVAGTADNSSVDWTENISAASGTYCTLYETDGGALSVNYSTSWSQFNDSSNNAVEYDPQVIGVPINLSKVLINHTNFGSVTLPACRGVVPGLHSTVYRGYRDKTLPIIRTFEGNDYRLITGYKVANAFIQMSGEWYV